ncbi:hypothetical protein IWZ03DRAFT_342239 [Phyllosticta citriasiana]|uniref:FAD-binding PCMH-type domain-containing protein n=2 Tax=Phyllosticta citriasiana TaxID=595635 RepID=A0ABR1KV26_9PEZI
MIRTICLPWVAFALLLFNLHFSIAIPPKDPKSACRCMPGDECWPSVKDWAQLNKTVGGKLISNIPLAHVCHDPFYNQEDCDYLKEQWAFPLVHETSSTSVMMPWFQNGSCDPFTPREQPCELGNYPDYSIDVSSADDIAAGVKFAQKMNIRFFVKNTGHDFLGKSVGNGALSLWTSNMKSTQVIKKYKSSYYNGPALKMAAGVRGADVYPVAKANGLVVVGGSCPSVGLVGGFTQGGGHSILTSSFGMGADQVLEWEVVTADGRRITATPKENKDLYWALSGGSPGAFGVVVSMTVRAYKDRRFGGAALSFTSSGITNDTFWQAFSSWQAHVPAIVDSGASATYLLSANLFLIQPLTYPGATEDQTRNLLKPFTDNLDRLKVAYSLNVTSYSNFLDHYSLYLGPLPGGVYPVDRLMGGRLIPREAVTKNNEGVVEALRFLAENTNAYLGFSAIKSNAKMAVAANAVLPQWRSSVITSLLQTLWNFSAPREANVAQLNELNEVVVPKITEVTPGSGTYLNEANFALQTWKEDFYGVNYEKLLRIKKKWDNRDLFYGPTMVGSDAWVVSSDGRLCRS